MASGRGKEICRGVVVVGEGGGVIGANPAIIRSKVMDLIFIQREWC